MVCSSSLFDWGPCVFLFNAFVLYRVIQEETLIYVEVHVNTWTRVWFWMDTEMEVFESPDLMPLDFCLWVWVDSEVFNRKCGHTRRIAPSHFGCCCQHKETWRSTLDEQHAIFAHELQRALRLTVGFSNFYCELWHICYLIIKLKLKWNCH